VIRQIAIRILAALHATLGRWLAARDQMRIKRKRTSWFACDSDSLRAKLPCDSDAEEMAEWERRHNLPTRR
jgi:hypothetical protein